MLSMLALTHSLSSAFFENPKIIYDLSRKFGSQSVVVTLDINISDEGKYKLHNNSLFIMGGSAQKYWAHGIPVKINESNPRWSLTFREYLV